MSTEPETVRRDWRISDELWERLQPLLPARKPPPLGCHRPRVDDRKAMDAIFFVLRTGCQWNALNATGICSSNSAHRRCQAWVEADVCVAWWKTTPCKVLTGHGSPWTARCPTCPSGGKRWASIRPTAARAAPNAASSPTAVACPSVWLCLEKGYDYDEVRDLLEEFGFTAHMRARGAEAKALKEEAGFKARRWVVERTHSWMNRFRRVLLRWAKKVRNYLGFLHLVCAYITYRQAGLLG
jgi:putative transposase